MRFGRKDLHRRQLPSAALAIFLGSLLALPQPALAETSDLVVKTKGKPGATVLLIHFGGFVGGGPALMRPHAELYARHGYRAVAISYPLGNIPAAYRSASAKARRYNARFAIGESAGATIAAWLAAKRRVDAAVAASGPQNLARWPEGEQLLQQANLYGRARTKYSPVTHYTRRSSPLLAVHYTRDPVVPLHHGRALANRGAQLLIFRGTTHIGTAYHPYARRFLRRHR